MVRPVAERTFIHHEVDRTVGAVRSTDCIVLGPAASLCEVVAPVNHTTNICSQPEVRWPMATYEFTLRYDQPFDQMNRAFLASVLGAPQAPLDGARADGEGVALTFVVVAPGEDIAQRIARQRAGSLWPNFHSVSTEVRVLDDSGDG